MHIYGPVPSRRLGYSLGIDILPFKTCSLDCIYCQLGTTRRKTIHQKKYCDVDEVLNQLDSALFSEKRVDFITFSGSGEPTLDMSIGKLIQALKKNTQVPVAVLTNSTLLSQKGVRDALSLADLVIPSLDAATQEIFVRVNRPFPSLKVRQMITGLKKFRQEFNGKIWLEVLFVKGVNDSPSHVKKLKMAISEINPDKIHLNTVVRPPADKSALPLTIHELEKIGKALGKKAEVVAEFDRIQHVPASGNLEEAILSMVVRRPVTLADLSRSLGKTKKEITEFCDHLLKKDKIKVAIHGGKKFFESKKTEK